MKAFYGKGAYRRSQLPELKLINLFVEKAPVDEEGVVLLSRKGLTEHSEAGDGPVNGVFRQARVFDGDVFSLSGGILYRGTVEIGHIAGDGPVSFAAGTSSELAINAGASIYRYDGSTLVAVTFPDTANAVKVLFHDGLYLALRADDHKWYWSAALDADTWNALSFASAESRPDSLLDALVVRDMLYLFGQETIEPWANTGASTPYARHELAILSKGIRATGCAVEIDNAIGFVGNDNVVYRLEGANALRISDHGIEERVAGSESLSCFGFLHEGHSFLCVRGDDFTLAYDFATGQWCELQSLGRDNFRAFCATIDSPIFGDDETGKLWTLDGYDDDGGELERRFTAAIPLNGGTATIDSISLWNNPGATDLLSGQGSDPVCEMRASRDQGRTWGAWRSAPLGAQGNYRTRTAWRRCGMYDAPGALLEFRVTDPVPVRINAVLVNEPGGGRSR